MRVFTPPRTILGLLLMAVGLDACDTDAESRGAADRDRARP
jgi:hypothetical protein